MSISKLFISLLIISLILTNSLNNAFAQEIDYISLNTEINDNVFQIEIPQDAIIIDTTDNWRQKIKAYKKIK